MKFSTSTGTSLGSGYNMAYAEVTVNRWEKFKIVIKMYIDMEFKYNGEIEREYYRKEWDCKYGDYSFKLKKLPETRENYLLRSLGV